MNPHIQKANDDYTAAGIDFNGLLGWHLAHGVVICMDDCFALGFDSFSDKPDKPLVAGTGDTLFVTYSTGNLRRALQAVVEKYGFIAWQRSFKGVDHIRVRNAAKLLTKLTERDKNHGI